MSLLDPRAVVVPDHLGDLDYEDLIVDFPYNLRVPVAHSRARRYEFTERG